MSRPCEPEYFSEDGRSDDVGDSTVGVGCESPSSFAEVVADDWSMTSVGGIESSDLLTVTECAVLD